MNKTDLAQQPALVPIRPWFVAGTAIVLMGLGTSLSLSYIAQTGNARPLLSHQGLVPFITLSYAVLGGLVASRHPRNAIGWFFLATATLYAFTAIVVGVRVNGSLDPAAWRPWSLWLGWVGRWAWLPAPVLPLVFALLFFPDGRLLSGRWRWLAWLASLALAAAALSLALHPGPIPIWNIPDLNPFGIPGAGPWLEQILNFSALLLVFSWLGASFAVLQRFRRASGVEREQLKWVVYTTAMLFLGLGLAYRLAIYLLSEAVVMELGIILSDLFVLGIAVSISLAVLRYRLYDIDLVINRTLVYGVLSLAVVAVYGLLVGLLGVLSQTADNVVIALFLTGLAAVIFQPVRDRLQRAVNRLMYGERDDPYTALSRLGQRLEGTLAPEAVLPNIVETVAQTLRLPYVAIALASPSDSGAAGPVVAAYGSPVTEPLRLPLSYQAETIGELIASPRAGESFSPADLRLLADLARQAGVAAHAVRLTADLQYSREQLVTTREEERRRLRRDLHDGLGSQFAALHLRADTLRTLIPTDPAAAEAVALELRNEIRAAITDIRRLVYELRPPALDELGLAGAMRALATQRTATAGLQITIEAPDPLPPLPAAVEVAAYRIAQEALTNVARHAQAQTCLIRLALRDDLHLEIKDDGIGLPPQYQAGVGLRSMRERAAEVGGTCAAETLKNGGVRILARLPLPLVRG